MPQALRRILVTGANGNIGRALFDEFATSSEAPALRGAVRSQRAAAKLLELPEASRPETTLVDYGDEARMREAANDCDAIVHLVGIIKEAASTRYEVAHEQSCEVLARAAAAAGARRIVYLSIVGSHPDSKNACLASKGRAEQVLLQGAVPATVLRVPMVLGRGDYATAALRSQSRAGRVALVGGGRTLQQPVDARDVARAIAAACGEAGGSDAANPILDFGGPECLSHRELVGRAARMQGRPPPRVFPIPLPAARVFAALLSRALANPPITPAMLGVLQHDDRIDPGPACKQLELELTPLDVTLEHCLIGPQGGDQRQESTR